MPVYHFHVGDEAIDPDHEGFELPDLAAAQREALALASFMIRHELGDFWIVRQWKMSVTDSGGNELFSLALTGSLTTDAAERKIIA